MEEDSYIQKVFLFFVILETMGIRESLKKTGSFHILKIFRERVEDAQELLNSMEINSIISILEPFGHR